jgi:hypothetical protein
MRRIVLWQILGLFWLSAAPLWGETTPATTLAQLRAVGRAGEGNVAAARAWKDLVRQGPAVLPKILSAMDGADAIAANWLRTAFDAIAEHAFADDKPLPADQLEQFVRQTKHAGPARRLAYEWLCRVDPKASGRLLPGMLQDPSPELRRDAVAVVIQDARALLEQGDPEAAKETYQKALAGACDKDQVDTIVKQLDKLGVKVDVAAHFGFVRQWLLAAPFDNTQDAGFAVAYPPEKGVDPKAVYQGKKGASVRWLPHGTKDAYGVVDLNKALVKQQGVVAYAYAVIDSPAARRIQIRAGSTNATKIFLNGDEVFQRDEYHHGMEVDQFTAEALLKAGRNELLLKVCQNEQKEDWAQNWRFQVRLCDAVGAAVPFTQIAVKSDPATKEEARP